MRQRADPSLRPQLTGLPPPPRSDNVLPENNDRSLELLFNPERSRIPCRRTRDWESVAPGSHASKHEESGFGSASHRETAATRIDACGSFTNDNSHSAESPPSFHTLPTPTPLPTGSTTAPARPLSLSSSPSANPVRVSVLAGYPFTAVHKLSSDASTRGTLASAQGANCLLQHGFHFRSYSTPAALHLLASSSPPRVTTAARVSDPN